MEKLAELLEEQLESAVEIKNQKALHRYTVMLTENLAHQDRNERDHSEIMRAILKVDSRMEEGFKRMDERFIAMQQQMDHRFEAMDKRFEALQKQMDVRFEALQKQMDQRFEAVQKQMDHRFEAMDKRFESIQKQMHSKFTMLFWFITSGFVVLTTLITVFQFLG